MVANDDGWDTKSVKQAVKGVGKTPTPKRQKLALTSRMVQKLIKEAMGEQNIEMANLMSISRLFLLRTPSEGIPLEWDGNHSRISVDKDKAVIALMKRKSSRVPADLSTSVLLCHFWSHIMCGPLAAGTEGYVVNAAGILFHQEYVREQAPHVCGKGASGWFRTRQHACFQKRDGTRRIGCWRVPGCPLKGRGLEFLGLASICPYIAAAGTGGGTGCD